MQDRYLELCLFLYIVNLWYFYKSYSISNIHRLQLTDGQICKSCVLLIQVTKISTRLGEEVELQSKDGTDLAFRTLLVECSSEISGVLSHEGHSHS